MLRRLIVPIFAIFAVGGLATMCTAVSGARARRRLKQRQLAAAPAAAPARRARDSVSAAAAPAQIVACPERLPDIAGWKRLWDDGSLMEIPVPPDFTVVDQTGSPESNPPFLILRALNGDEYRLTRAPGPIHSRDVRDLEQTSSCRVTRSDYFVDIETARDTWRGGEHRAVLATYWLTNHRFITIQGTTESAEHQRQLVAAIHGTRFRGE